MPHARCCRVGEVPAIEWEKDFQTWEGLGGWIVVNLVCFAVTFVCIPAATTPCCEEEGREGRRRKEVRREEEGRRTEGGKVGKMAA